MSKGKLAVLFSGGKDSCLALDKVRSQGVKFLLNVFPKNKDSYMFHKPNKELLEEQARQLNLPLLTIESKGEKEEELRDLEELIDNIKGEVEGIVTGGIASSYQGKRVKKICDKLGLEFISPLWDYESEELWDELLEKNFEVILTKISCGGLGKDWLNRIIDKDNFGDLKKESEKYKFRIDFEGGEAETSVLWMPGMDKKIKVEGEKRSEGKYRHFLDIREIRLKEC